jgi:hypothetical protein
MAVHFDINTLQEANLKIIALILALTLEKHPQGIDHFLGPVKR